VILVVFARNENTDRDEKRWKQLWEYESRCVAKTVLEGPLRSAWRPLQHLGWRSWQLNSSRRRVELRWFTWIESTQIVTLSARSSCGSVKVSMAVFLERDAGRRQCIPACLSGNVPCRLDVRAVSRCSASRGRCWIKAVVLSRCRRAVVAAGFAIVAVCDGR